VAGFIGAVGAKIAGLPATVITALVVDTFYGLSALVIARESGSGHTLKWFSSAQPSFDLEPGNEIIITSGRVKAHETYNGDDQTVIVRPKFTVVSTEESES
jgi:hypothetical protein